MNEIKFRVYDKEEKCYLSDFDLENLLMDMHGKLSWYTINPYGAGNEIDFPNLVVEQYADIEDVNGMDIYEGDRCIYKYEDFIIKDGGGTGHLEQDWLPNEGVVTWKDGAFRFELPNGLWIVLFQNRELKVIGTIHDKK